MLLLQRIRWVVTNNVSRYRTPEYTSLYYQVNPNRKNYATDLWEKFQSRSMGRKGNATKDSLIKCAKEKIKAPASKILLSVVGNGQAGAPKSLLMTTTYACYMFNMGEGCTRVVEENKQKLTGLEHAFFTHNSWANLGGMVGLTINLYQGKEDSKLRVHGPPHAEKVIAASRNFCDLEKLVVGKTEVSEGEFEDTTFRIQYVPLYATKEDAEEPARKKWKGQSPPRGDSNKDGKLDEMAVVYICTPKPLRRNIDLKKCLDRGLPSERTEYMKQLMLEKDVTLENGTVVKAEDVLDKYQGDLGSIVVIECPNEAYLDSLASSERLQGLQGVHCVVHFTPCQVMATPTYQKWMHSLDLSVKHFLLNDHPHDGEVSIVTPLQNQVLMNHLHSEVFPHLLQYHQNPQQPPEMDTQNEEMQTMAKEKNGEMNTEETSLNLIYGKTNMTYLYREGKKNQQLCSENCPIFDMQAACELIPTSYLTSEKMKSLKEYQETLVSTRGTEKSEGTKTGMYPEIVFLGTGSSKPSAMRNASGILVQLSETTNIILDCGEGTYGQILRLFGQEKTRTILRNLKAIFVSHLHADHHMGVLAVLMARHKLMAEEDGQPPYVLAPHPYKLWLNLIQEKVVNIHNHYRYVSLESLKDDNSADVRALCGYLGLKQFLPVRVLHRQHPYGIVLCTNEDYKLVYSGDTKPCPDLCKAGRNCDLLIHEATLADDKEAAAKFHSSFSQALEVGDNMKAKFTILTHVSQRYSNVSSNASREFKLDRRNYGIAFDNMRVTPALLPVLASLVPVVKHLFAGLRRAEYSSLIDDEIDLLLGGNKPYSCQKEDLENNPDTDTDVIKEHNQISA